MHIDRIFLLSFSIIFSINIMSKALIESISFDLTTVNLDLPSQSLIESPLKLEYSISRLSITNDEPTFAIHIQHDYVVPKEINRQEQRADTKSSHIFQLGEAFRRCYGPYVGGMKLTTAAEHKTKHQNRKNTQEPRSLSNPKKLIQRRSRSNESQHAQSTHFCVLSKAFHHGKAIHNARQNQESLQRMKPIWMREENKPKSTLRAGIYEKQQGKYGEYSSKKGNRENLQELVTAVTTKKLNLSQNELQIRKYTQKININRQNLLHQSHKVCIFPAV